MFIPLNPDFYAVVQDARTYAMGLLNLQGADLSSEAFLSRFPIFVLEELGENEVREDPRLTFLRERLISAAFANQYCARTEEAITVFCSDQGDDTPHGHLFRMVDDFLNWAMPRSVGLPDESAQFDALYAQFEKDLFTASYTLNVIAPLENFSDDGGRFRGEVAGLRFAYASRYPGSLHNSAHVRRRAMLYLELKKTHVLGVGGIRDSDHYFLLEFQEVRAKKKGELIEAYKRAGEITRKVVLTARLLTFEPVYAQCIGLRALFHYSGGGQGMVLWNPGDEWIDERSGADLKSCAEGFRRLLPHVLAAPAASIETLFLKIDDAFRRRRKTARPFGDGKAREDIDRLLDYCQALEAILPFGGGKKIPKYAATLLQSSTPSRWIAATDHVDFLVEMYKLRNNVMHGNFYQVLEDRAGTHYKLKDVERFRRCAHYLAVLYFLNPDQDGKPNLGRFKKQLERGQVVNLKKLYDP